MPCHLSLEFELLNADPGILGFSSRLEDSLKFLSIVFYFFKFSTKEI